MQVSMLRFRPTFRYYMWGGDRLSRLLGREVGSPDGACAESWEIVDRGEDQSIVLAGDCAGWTLHDVIVRCAPAVLGRAMSRIEGSAMAKRFPLLVKWLDAAMPLSVQVHPNDAQAAALDPPDLGKTEAWVVLHAEPGSRIYAGLESGVDRASLAGAIRAQRCEECLHWFEPQIGDCVFIPAGTVHALGAGLLVAEIQQASDTTFRIYDWNRPGPDGRLRPLHVEQALDVIDFERGPVDPVVPRAATPGDFSLGVVERLVEDEKFLLDRWSFQGLATLDLGERFHVVMVLSGELEIPGDPAGRPLRAGDTALLPAALGRAALQSRGPVTLLDAYLPAPGGRSSR